MAAARDPLPLDSAPAPGQVGRMTVIGFIARAARVVFFVAAGLVALFVVLLVPWRFVPPTSVPMVTRSILAERVERVWRPIEGIDRDLIRAVIASEDNGFCHHHGIDWGELIEVLDDEDGPQRGASTITMQVAKNLFLWNGRSYVRKALEIPLALVIDLAWPKRRILEVYLNIAEWGPEGEFGIEAGTRRAFGHGAERMSAGEAALLAVTLPNPLRRTPGRPAPGLRRLAGLIAKRAAGSPDFGDCAMP